MEFCTYIIDGNGQRIGEGAFDGKTNAKLIKKETACGFALYLDARSATGFGCDESVLLRPLEYPVKGHPYQAIENHSPYWSRPAWGDDFSTVPAHTQELIWKEGEHWCAILPLCGDVFKAELRGCEEGLECLVYANCDGITECREAPVLLFGEGEDPIFLYRALAHEASRILGCPLREEREEHPLFDFFGWCSWDAFQIRVSHEKLLLKAAEFKEKGIPVHYVIIDDMWADVPHLNEVPDGISFDDMVREMHASPIRSFEGDPIRFPNGMKAAIDDLKAAGIPKVGVWFPTTGYWFGLLPDSPVHKEFAEHVVAGERGRLVVAPELSHAAHFYGTLCERVKSWDADFVKIDNQGFHYNYRGIAPIGASARAVQTAIDGAARACFDGALINCMGMPTECMFHRPTSAISRCSGDFLPENRAWFSRHILQTSYNGLLQGQFYVNDWDMWWTDDGQAKKNSLCRAISGGPIYVSDKLGRSRPELLAPLMFSDGRLARCDRSAIPSADCIIENPMYSGKVFKIQNVKGDAGLVAVFNLDEGERAVTGTVSPGDAGLPAGRYAYYEHFTGENGILEGGETLSLTLESTDDFRLYTFLPYSGSPVCFGNVDMFVGVGAVTEREDNSVKLYEGGRIAFFSEELLSLSDGNAELRSERKGRMTFTDVSREVHEVFYKNV